jgi:hypothetical protein
MSQLIETVVQIQQCVSCAKVRFLGNDFIWSHWKDDYQNRKMNAAVAEFVICDHCKNHVQKRRKPS